MNNFTFLTNEQIFENNKLDIIKKCGAKSAITDFSILLGGYTSSNFSFLSGKYNLSNNSEGNNGDSKTGWWWTKSLGRGNNIIVVDQDGNSRLINSNRSDIGIRPAFPYSLIRKNDAKIDFTENEVKEIEYGEYPQTIVKESYSTNLDRAYNTGIIKTTGKSYTIDSDIPKIYTEYEYNGRKYIRFISDQNCNKQILSDGREIKPDKVYWINVEPITWLVDGKSDIALSKKIIVSGIKFKNSRDYNGDFENTDINKFMNNRFAKEIIFGAEHLQNIQEKFPEQEKQKAISKQYSYEFDFGKVSEEDIIIGAIESNVPVFLHGKSCDGKSARVKQLDPNCEIIYLKTATADSLNGKSFYDPNTGKIVDIKPTWYLNIEEKCKKEPNKIHIIFFDELTNIPTEIQDTVINIALDGKVNGKWSIPSNARIVAAGNNLNDSLENHQISETLYNRFAHVYINTTVDNWLKWASEPNQEYTRLNYQKIEKEKKIHPYIYAYIAYKMYSGSDVLRTEYTGDKPNANPRKWEMASKILYKTKQPEMLRSLIGDNITQDFINFTKQQVISVEDVIRHNYSKNDLKMNLAQQFVTAVELSSVDDIYFEIAQDFMKEIGEEARNIFESMWAYGDEKRLEKIARNNINDNLSKTGIKR